MSLVAVGLLFVLGAQQAELDAVLLTRKSGLTPAQAAELQSKLTRALEDNGLRVRLSGATLATALKKLGVKDTAACNGRRTCVQELAAQLQATTLVSASASRVDGETAIALELVRAGDAPLQVSDSFVVPPGATAWASLTQAFSAKVIAALAPPRADPAPPLPPPPSLLPEPPPANPVLVLPSPPPRSRAGPVALTALGGASFVAGVALVVAAAVTRGELAGAVQPDGRRVSRYDEQTALQLNDQANVFTGVGIGAAALGAGLLTGAIITW